MRTYYAGCEYECEDRPGEFASITILGDEDGPHVVFSTSDEVLLDLPIPPCEALAVSFALARAGKHAIIAAEHLTERLADLRSEDTGRHGEPPPLEPGMMRRALPVQRSAPGYSPPASWVGGPDRRTA